MKTNKQDAQARLSTLESLVNEQLTEIEALRKIIEAPEPVKGLWKFGPDGEGFFIGISGDVLRSYGITACRELQLHGNCFPTREAAEKAAPLMARANKIIGAALQADPDAGVFDRHTREYCVYQPRGCGEWMATNTAGDYGSITVCVHTRAQAEEMVAILNQEGVK